MANGILDIPIYADEMDDMIARATQEDRIKLVGWITHQETQLDQLKRKSIMCISQEGRSQFVRAYS